MPRSTRRPRRAGPPQPVSPPPRRALRGPGPAAARRGRRDVRVCGPRRALRRARGRARRSRSPSAASRWPPRGPDPQRHERLTGPATRARSDKGSRSRIRCASTKPWNLPNPLISWVNLRKVCEIVHIWNESGLRGQAAARRRLRSAATMAAHGGPAAQAARACLYPRTTSLSIACPAASSRLRVNPRRLRASPRTDRRSLPDRARSGCPGSRAGCRPSSGRSPSRRSGSGRRRRSLPIVSAGTPTARSACQSPFRSPAASAAPNESLVSAVSLIPALFWCQSWLAAELRPAPEPWITLAAPAPASGPDTLPGHAGDQVAVTVAVEVAGGERGAEPVARPRPCRRSRRCSGPSAGCPPSSDQRRSRRSRAPRPAFAAVPTLSPGAPASRSPSPSPSRSPAASAAPKASPTSGPSAIPALFWAQSWFAVELSPPAEP